MDYYGYEYFGMEPEHHETHGSLYVRKEVTGNSDEKKKIHDFAPEEYGRLR